MTTLLVLAAALAVGAAACWAADRLLGRLHLDGAERLALALTLTPGLLGLAAFFGFLVGRPGPWLPLAVALALVAVAALTPKAALRERGAPRTVGPGERGARGEGSPPGSDVGRRQVAVATGLFGAVALGLTAIQPVSGAAYRLGDWLAHWFLVVIFLGQPLPDTRVFVNRVGHFGIISRPPQYNLEGGLLVGALDYQFWPFQLASTLIGVPIAAAAVLWARNIGGGRAAGLVAGMAALNAFLLQNTTYPWGKVPTAAFVLLFLHLVRAAALTRDARRGSWALVSAAACFGFGYMSHPTALFYALATGLWLVWRRPRPLFRVRWWAWPAGLLVVGLIVAPWYLWAIGTFGLRATLEASPAFPGDVPLGEWVALTVLDGVATLVPLPLLEMLADGSRPSADALLRAPIGTLSGAVGVAGCLLLGRAAWRAARRHPSPGGRVAALVRRPPWLLIVAVVTFGAQIWLQPIKNTHGDAGHSLAPLVVFGLAYAARELLTLSPAVRHALVALMVLEGAFFQGLYGWWAFGSAWIRDGNTVLAARYQLAHLRSVWPTLGPLGAALTVATSAASAVLLWRAAGVPAPRPSERAGAPARLAASVPGREPG